MDVGWDKGKEVGQVGVCVEQRNGGGELERKEQSEDCSLPKWERINEARGMYTGPVIQGGDGWRHGALE